MRAVLDAGPIIHLSWIDRLDLLDQLFEEVFLPPAVRDEVLAAPSGATGMTAITQALNQGHLQVRHLSGSASAIGSLQPGETEAIRLAQESGINLLITDDLGARREAERLGLTVTGTLGVLRSAHHQGLVPAVLPILFELRRLGQWISEELVEQVRDEEANRPP